ncbi:MAG TPA: carboxypeptidase regulatory-like domain-containing protein [Spirochaetota bacterium]|nr:carboxypeptidase regulatory-like domain-containing protein [Spirochaetota bacterium]
MKRSWIAGVCTVILTAIIMTDRIPGTLMPENSGALFAKTNALEEKAFIEGTITDSVTGKPVKGAVVEIKNANRGVGYYKTETNRNGYYRINDFIPYIKYEIEISSDGYVSYIQTASITAVKNDIKLTKESLITGTVKDSSGNPLTDVEIALRPTYDYYEGESDYSPLKPVFSRTDSKGNYVFNKLKAGPYLATFTKAGYITETASLSGIKSAENFKLQMVMYRPASVEGKVMIKGLDSPAVNINVTAEGRYSYSNVTYRDGSFILEDVKPGNYTLTLSHQGFHQIKIKNLKVNEGVKLDNLKYNVEAKSPEINIHSYRYTFTPGNEVEFNLRTLRLDTVHVRVYKVPFENFITGNREPESMTPEKSGFKTVTEWDESVKDFNPYEWMYYSVKVNKPLTAGGYCIEVKGKGDILARKFFTVTNIGVVVKRSPGSINAYVTDLVQNRPVKNVSIVIYDHNFKKKNNETALNENQGIDIERLPVKVLGKGKTDENGIFKTSAASDQRMFLLAVTDEGSYAICSAGASNYYRSEKDKIFIYTDRPVYRTGDKIYFKIIAKRMEQKFLPIKNRTLYYSIQKSYSGKEISSGSMELDEWGTIHGNADIPGDSELGYFTIRAGFKENDMYGTGSFYIEQYRKPEFKVEIMPSKDFFINGETAEFKVESKYFFGAPLTNVLVKYRFYERKIDTDEDPMADEYRSESSYSRMRLEGEKYTDANGNTLLKIASGNYPYDREITLEASVTDKSNITITSRKTVKIGRGEFFIKITPEENFFGAKSEKKVTVTTLTHSGKPVSTNLELNLLKYIWKPVQRVYIHDSRPYFTKKITTDVNGKAVFTLPGDFTAYGEFDLKALGSDAKGNIITGSKIIWIYNDAGGSADSKLKDLELTVNKSELENPGEITCLVKSRFTDSYVFVSLEGRELYEYRVIKMSKNIVPVKFRIDTKLAPNLFVRCAMQRGRALYTAEQEVTIPVDDVKLKLTLTPDKEKYSPGETIKVKLKAVDEKGTPASADISLAAVDESIFMIRSDNTPEISGYFYSKISNWVLTAYSYPITLLAGAGKDAQVKIRENFRDTAFWESAIRTDRNGEAEISFKAPDNLTTWRLTARGHDREGRMGESRKKFLATQDIIARLGKPRFLVEGDRIGIIGIVNNNTDSGIEKITTELKAEGRTVAADKDFPVSLTGFGSARKFYTMNVPEGKDSVVLEYSALTQAKKGDAVKHTVPVEKRGIKYAITATGDSATGNAVEIKPVKGTEDFEFVPEEIKITLTPSPILQMIKAAEYLNSYPYGCIEQTINRFIPKLALLSLMKNSEYSNLIPDKLSIDIKDDIPEGIRKIESGQNYDGSWGWWNGDRGNGYLTGYALFSLYFLKQNRYEINDNVVQQGLDAVQRFFEDTEKSDNDELSYLLYIYALHQRWDHGAFKRIAFDEKINPYQAANILKALTVFKGSNRLQEFEAREIKQGKDIIVKKIKSAAKRDSGGVYWPETREQVWSWPGGRSEITAHVISALVLSGEEASLASQGVATLARGFNGQCWNSTKGSGTVILALCDYLKDKSRNFKTSGNAVFTLNGKKLGDISYNLKDSKSLSQLTKSFPLNRENRSELYNLKAEGDLSGGAVFSAAVSGTLYFRPQGFFSFIKSEKRSIRALSSGIEARRDMFYLNRIKDQKMQEYLVPQGADEKGKISVGDELLVRVKFRPEESFGFLMLEDFLPSGFEVVTESAYNEFQPYSHVEKRDNRVVFFFTGVEKDKEYEVAYIIRAELSGSFIMRPSRISCMYEESVQGWSQPAVIDVNNE